MTLVTTTGADPARIDRDVIPGEEVDFTVPVYDAAGNVQSLSGWALAATAHRDDTVLHTFTTTAVAGGVQVYASPGQTAPWADWPAPSVRWSLWLTPPASPPYPFAAGWVRVTAH